MKSTMLLAVWLLCCACPAPAPVMAAGDHYDCAKRYEALSDVHLGSTISRAGDLQRTLEA